MAKKRFRFDTIPKEEKTELISYLRSFEGLHSGGLESLLDEIEKGNIPKDFKQGLSKIQNGDVLVGRIESILSKSKPRQTALKDYLESTKDEAILSDEQLQERLQAFQEYTPISSAGSEIDAGVLNTASIQRLEQLFSSSAFKDSVNLGGVRESAIDLSGMIASGNINSQFIAEQILKKSGITPSSTAITEARNIINAAVVELNDRLKRGEFSREITSAESTQPDVKRIQDIIESRKTLAESSKELNEFLASTPEEQNRLREEFFNSERRRGTDYLKDVGVPSIRQNLASRGLADSGQFGYTVGSKYQEVMGGIESAEIQQLQEDIDFWSNMSYQKTLSDLLFNKTQLDTQIKAEREKTLTEQQRGFERKSSALSTQYNLDAFNRESERAFNQYITDLTRKTQDQKAQREQEMYAQAGGTAASVATTVLLSFL